MPPLPLGERATRAASDAASPPRHLDDTTTERERTLPATTRDADDAPTGEIEPNLWNGFGYFALTRRTELAAQAITETAVLFLLAVGAFVTRYQSEHEPVNAPVAARAGTMVVGLLWSVLIAPATLAALWFVAKFALHVIVQKHEARAWQEQAEEAEEP